MFREERLRIRGVEVRALRAGRGAPLVHLHGAAGLPQWNPYFEALAARHEVLVPEHPGFGLSDNPPRIRTVQDVAMHYLDLLDALDLRRVHLCGNSLGGWVAAELAVRNCTRLASLTLVSPAGLRVKGVPSGDNFIWGPEEGLRNLYHDQSIPDRILAQPPSEAEADIALTNRFAAARLGWEPRWFNPILHHWLHRVTVPALVLWGQEDRLFPVAYSEAWAQAIPGVQVQTIPACGHLPHVERAAEAADRVLSFLAGK